MTKICPAATLSEGQSKIHRFHVFLGLGVLYALHIFDVLYIFRVLPVIHILNFHNVLNVLHIICVLHELHDLIVLHMLRAGTLFCALAKDRGASQYETQM